MKKILVILVIMFLLVSCESKSIHFSEGNGVLHDVEIEIKKNILGYDVKIYKLQYNNHECVVFEKGLGYSSTIGS